MQLRLQGDSSTATSTTAGTATSAALAVAEIVGLGAASGRRRAKQPKVMRLQQARPELAPTMEINYYEMDAVDAPQILAAVRNAIAMASHGKP